MNFVVLCEQLKPEFIGYALGVDRLKDIKVET
jgi:hypothetical protein